MQQAYELTTKDYEFIAALQHDARLKGARGTRLGRSSEHPHNVESHTALGSNGTVQKIHHVKNGDTEGFLRECAALLDANGCEIQHYPTCFIIAPFEKPCSDIRESGIRLCAQMPTHECIAA